jgi:hypothetical protein
MGAVNTATLIGTMCGYGYMSATSDGIDARKQRLSRFRYAQAKLVLQRFARVSPSLGLGAAAPAKLVTVCR